jgi:predicted TIM-barrel fold metal-dependent hydrolase
VAGKPQGQVLARDPEGNEYAVLDVHQHVPTDAAAWDSDLRERLIFMDRFGISQACVLPPAVRPAGATVDAMNESVSAYQRATPDRFPVALGTVDLMVDEKTRRGQVGRLRDLGLSGVIWHHMFDGQFMDWPSTCEAIDECRALDLRVFVHVMVGSLLEAPWRLGKLCEQFPDLRIVALDGLSSPHHGQAMIELARQYPQLVLDTSVLATFGNLLRRFVEVNGDERLVFGTDFEPNAFSFPYPLAEILHNPALGPESRAKVLRHNAARVFGLEDTD